MIHSLQIKDADRTPIPWLSKVPALAQPCTFEFRPGLNVLWGRNGSGKSTLITMLARLFHCAQSNYPVVTVDSLKDFLGGRFGEVDIASGVRVVHDGQGVRHFDPGHAVGLIGGMAAFDWDFSLEGVANATFKGSSGQTTLFRFDKLLGEIVEGKPCEVRWDAKEEALNSTWSARLKQVQRFLQSNGAPGPLTVLLDEPERSLDVNAVLGLWRLLRAYADQYQFIVASHSLFALGLPDTHYIDLSPGYLAKSLEAVERLRTWAAEKPSKLPKKSVPPPPKPSKPSAQRKRRSPG